MSTERLQRVHAVMEKHIGAGDIAGVVALETSVIGQGLPEPRNRECVERMEGAIRARGAVPAWIAVADGAVRVGVDPAVLDRKFIVRPREFSWPRLRRIQHRSG